MRLDLEAICLRDPASGGPLQCLLNFKGFQALQAHRCAHALWSSGRHDVALWLQGRASSVLGVDIHPAARLGGGLMLDHGTGVVIGETAVVGPNCSFLHGVTLGGTGKDGKSDRHPKVGPGVLIGAGASVLGNIVVGEGAKIGCGAVVVKPIPPYTTAAGIPAKIVGKATPVDPRSAVDHTLVNDCSAKWHCVWKHVLEQNMSSVKGKAQANGGSGVVVTCYNLQNALKPLGVTEAECLAIFSKMDRNADGVITQEEFEETWQEAAKNYKNRACAKGSSLGCCELLKKICTAIRNDQPPAPATPEQPTGQ